MKGNTELRMKIAASIAALAVIAAGVLWAGPAQASQPEFICTQSGEGWQEKVDTTGDPATVTVTAPEGYLIDEYCVKAGTEKFIVPVVPPAVTVVIDHPEKGSVSHYQVHLTPAVVQPQTVVPNAPVVKDLCETENDHYGLPDETTGVTYSRDGLDIVATITAPNTVWGTLPAGWVAEGAASARFAFDPESFTDENCEVVLPEPAAFAAEPTPPTCDENGGLPLVELAEHVTLTWDREFDGPGVYTLTATADEGYEFADGSTQKSREFTVLGALGYQGDDPEAECYEAPPVPITLGQPTAVDACGVDEDSASLPDDAEGVVYAWLDSEDPDNFGFYAEVQPGYSVTGEPGPGWVFAEAGDGYEYWVYEWEPAFTDAPCPVTPPAPPAPPAPATLAATGGGDIAPVLPIGAAVMTMLGIAAVVWRKVRA